MAFHLNQKKYKAVFFDAGGTLLFPFPSVGEIYLEIATKHNINFFIPSLIKRAESIEVSFYKSWKSLNDRSTITNEMIEREKWKKLVYTTFETIGGFVDFDTFFEDLFMEFEKPSRWSLAKYSIDFLNYLKEKQTTIAIISNWDSRLLCLLKNIGLLNYFDGVYLSSDIGFAKPSPKLFTHAMTDLTLMPHEVIHIGDSWKEDVLGALSANITPLFYSQKKIQESSRNVASFTSFSKLMKLDDNH